MTTTATPSSEGKPFVGIHALVVDEDDEIIRVTKRPPPPEPLRLAMTGFMAFVKGALGSAIVIAPFFGVWAAVATALTFTTFCVWLAHKNGPGVGLIVKETVE